MQTDLTFSNLISLGQNYRSADKKVKETHLQGSGKELKGQDMEVMHKKELQRATNFVRNGLGLSYKETGTTSVLDSSN